MASLPPLDARRRSDPTPLSDTVTSRTPMPAAKIPNSPAGSTPDDEGTGAGPSDMPDESQNQPASLDSISDKIDMLTQLIVSWYGNSGQGGPMGGMGMPPMGGAPGGAPPMPPMGGPGGGLF